MKPLDHKKVAYLIVHCTASPEGLDLDAKAIDRMHRNRGFSMIGYHYLIKLDGTIEEGRPLDKQGAHVRGYNDESIGIAYVGGLDSARKAKDTRTELQQVAMVNLLEALVKKFPKAKIVGHRDLSPDLDGDGVVEKHEWMKQCPCFSAIEEYNFLDGAN